MAVKKIDEEQNNYYLDNIDAYVELKIGKFDPTWEYLITNKWEKKRIDAEDNIGYSKDEEFHYLTKLPVENIDVDQEFLPVSYRYNSDWYRCDSFTKEHDGLHVLFAGCSNTEGVGLNIEKTWPHMVYTELCKKYKLSGYFNIGKGGYGWQKIISATMNYINEYGKPDVLFINHPNIIRDYYWVPSKNKWIYAQKFPYEKPHAGKKNSYNTPENAQYEEINFYRWPTLDDVRNYFPGWVFAWFTFLEYCKALGIKVLWTTWDYQEGLNIKNLNCFKETFFEMRPIDASWIEKKRPNGKVLNDDINARDGHPGYLSHLNWSEEFLYEIKERGILNEFYKQK